MSDTAESKGHCVVRDVHLSGTAKSMFKLLSLQRAAAPLKTQSVKCLMSIKLALKCLRSIKIDAETPQKDQS